MTTADPPVTLTEFLLAQIAKDEAVAQAAVGTAPFQRQTGRWVFEHVRTEYGPVPIVFALTDDGGKAQAANLEAAWERDERGAHIASWDPARVLAECEARRRIVALHAPGDDRDGTCHTWFGTGDGHPDDLLCPTLRLLALPHADHPDWREEWRP